MTRYSPILGPTALRFKPVLTVTEQLGPWLKGYMVKDPSISVELSFEDYREHRCYRNSWFVYLHLFRGGKAKTLFEFQLGKLLTADPIVAEHIYDLINVAAGHTPIPVTDRPTDHVISLRRNERIQAVALMPRLTKT